MYGEPGGVNGIDKIAIDFKGKAVWTFSVKDYENAGINNQEVIRFLRDMRSLILKYEAKVKDDYQRAVSAENKDSENTSK